MGLFKKTLVTLNDIKYVRWEYDNEYYVGSWLADNTVKMVVDRASQATVDNIAKSDPESGRSRYWFVKTSDLEAEQPTSLILYCDAPGGASSSNAPAGPWAVVIQDNARALGHWYKSFQRDMSITVVEFDRVSGNPYGRFNNSSDAPEQTFVFHHGDVGKAAKAYLQQKDVARRLHTPYKVADAQPMGSHLAGMTNQFSVYTDQAPAAPIAVPAMAALKAVQDALFNVEDFTQDTETRARRGQITPQQAQAWFASARNPSQSTVMNGKSATDVAERLAIENVPVEWLHLIAHSLGPATGSSTPQTVDNLVFGTSAANTSMLMHEGLIQQATLYYGLTVHIDIFITCAKVADDTFAKWCASRLLYSYTVMEGAGSSNSRYAETIEFCPFDTVTPTLAEYELITNFGGRALVPTESMEPPNKKRRDAAMEPPVPEMTASARPATSTTAQGAGAPWPGKLAFAEVQPCNVVHGELVPLAAPAAMSETTGAAHGTLPPTTPGGRAFSAKTTMFALPGLPAQLDDLNDGTRQATVSIPSADFTFDKLFADFECHNAELFVFNDVSVHLERAPGDQEGANRLLFGGKLDLSNEYLAPVATFLKSGKSIYLSGEIDAGGQDLTAKLKPQFISLSSAASFLIPLADHLTLDSIGLNISVQRRMDFVAMRYGWTCGVRLTGVIEISNIAAKPVALSGLLSYAGGGFHVEASTTDVVDPFGIRGLMLDTLQVSLDVGAVNELRTRAIFRPSYRIYEFAGVIAKQYAGMYAEAENFALEDLADLFSNVTGLELALPEFDMTFEQVLVGVASADCSVGDLSLQEGLTVQARLTVHGHQCQATALIAPDGVSFTGSLDDVDIGPVKIEQPTLVMAIHTTASGKPTEFSLAGEAVVEDVSVKCSLTYERTGQSWNAVLYAGLDAASFGLSTVFPPAKGSFLDTLRFSKIAFIYSAAKTTTQNPEYPFAVQQGLQLMGVMDEIPALTSLTGSKHVGLVFDAQFGETTDITISMPDTRLKLGKSVTCDPFRIKVVITPSPALELIFGLDVTVPDQATPLHFDFVLEVGAVQASGSVTMKNYWDNPFGVTGLKIGPALALEVGIIYATFLDTGIPSEIGITGGIVVGSVSGDMAVKISESPMDEILLGKLDKLTATDLVTFAQTITDLKLAEADIPDFFDLKALKLYCAPAGGTIGTVTYQPGFSFSGDLVLFGKEVSVYAGFSQSGVEAKGELDRIAIGPLTVTGERGNNASVDLALTTDKQLIHIDGAFELLDASVGLFVDISRQGIHFEFDESFAGLLSYTIKGDSAGSLAKPGSLDFTLSSEFDNDLASYLAKTVAKRIQDATQAADKKLDAAQAAVDKAQKAYEKVYAPAHKKLLAAQQNAAAYVKQCQDKVTSEQKKYDAAFKAAQKELSAAKQTYDKAFSSASKKVAAAQGKYDAAMRKAQGALNKAQAAYDSALSSAQAAVNRAKGAYDAAFDNANSKLSDAQNKVNSLQSSLNSAENELKHLPWYKGYEAPKLLAEIGGLKTAIGVANGVLSAARKVVEGVKYGSDYTAWQGAIKTLNAVRTGGKYAALENAKKALDATRTGVDYVALQSAQQALKDVETGSDYVAWQGAQKSLKSVETTGRLPLTAAENTLKNVGSSAAYLALDAAQQALTKIEQGSEAIAFESAKATLAGVEQGSDAMLGLAQYLVKHGGELLDVRKVDLSGSLKAIERGELFAAQVDATVLGKPEHWSLQLDARDVQAFVDALFKKALAGAEDIAKAG